MRYANDLGLPAQFERVASLSRHPKSEKTYSVTEVLKGTTEVVLSRRHDDEITVDVADNVWAVFGSAVHSILENGQETDSQLKEEYVYLDMPNGYRLTGIFDLYDAESGVVTDWKTASVWRVMMHDWEGYRRQLLAYGVILRSMGFEVRGGQIIAFLKDHSKSKARFDREYPQRELYRIGWEFSQGQLDEMHVELVERLAAIERAEGVPDDDLRRARLRRGGTGATGGPSSRTGPRRPPSSGTPRRRPRSTSAGSERGTTSRSDQAQTRSASGTATSASSAPTGGREIPKKV